MLEIEQKYFAKWDEMVAEKKRMIEEYAKEHGVDIGNLRP